MILREVYKITVFAPVTAIERLLIGILKVTNLSYGPYEHVLWRSAPGMEQFRPLACARPTVGEIQELSEQHSIQLIFTVPRDTDLLHQVFSAVLEAHPWEQPVILAEEAMAGIRVHTASGER